MKCLIETRIHGLPWTREGCNERANGAWVPFTSCELAEAHIEKLKLQDDPMWAIAEYRVVTVKKAPRR